jgi:Phosphomannomutase
MGAEPDGVNINDGYGSTHPEQLQDAVVRLGADLGIAHDGDADRTLAVDHTGRLIDGDYLLAILALGMHSRGELRNNAVAVTVMSNLGLRRLLADKGITVHDTKVGDRYVLEALQEHSLSLGGEQSGHIILADHQTTGDGILTGLHIASEMVRSGSRLADLADQMTVYPQVLVNVPDMNISGLEGNQAVANVVAAAEAKLGESGRLLLRPSGTEPLVRIMVEAASREDAERIAQDIAGVVRQELG